MLEVRNRPILTDTYESLAEFIPEPGSVYVYAVSVEERSEHSQAWELAATDVLFVPISAQEPNHIVVTVNGEQRTVPLRGSRSIEQFWRDLGRSTVYLDFTGLSHHVWAPLMRGALSTTRAVRAVYVEPKEYSYSRTPTEGEIFDLSVRILGIAPLPGYASLGRPEEDAVFIPLLGFEGTRFKFLIEQVQPPNRKIVPIIGVPGFAPEYPFHTYMGNRAVLLETKAWRNVHYVRANCPFSAMYALGDIAAEWPADVLKVAPIGTKPHALGAVLYYLMSGRTVELVYDHPIRKPDRSKGASRVSVYHISSLQFSQPRLTLSTASSRNEVASGESTRLRDRF